ncbi:LacI family transcriptional regulator [Streptomyces sp. N2-109]|uniref:LacI family transcriptional regulator n=1 Tax=Streptomyces gossypii TaxID=2883101 RepID=A0ABT2JWZ3_9ACTN|nr:LacI family DNA-binding transcriptional regulator [Streptomyces gossypii]MCT2592423.1 LacI family transcriptional regulator [Streptomyces gossypii]
MATSRRPTLADVAERVGVSAKTVSRVLNSDGPVSAATREKVMAAVTELGFRPNLMARNMRVGARDSTIGLIVPQIANPFFGSVADGIEDAIRDRNLTLLLGSSDEDPEKEQVVVSSFLARRVTALMIVPSVDGDHRYLRRERSSGLPLIFIDRPGSGVTADAVVSANTEGTHDGVAHLIAHGHRRIGFIGDVPSSLYTRKQRQRGYRATLQAAGIPYDPALVADAHSPTVAGGAVRRLLALPQPPTALFTANNFASLGALTTLSADRRKDVALVGFDDLPLADLLEPGLSVIAQDPAMLGREAALLALSRLDGDRTAARTATVPTRLIPRGSGELPPPPG